MDTIHQAATPSAVAGYCAAGHTNAEAAARFGLHERTVRKWKARAAGASDRFTSSQVTPETGVTLAQVSVSIPAEWIARDGQLWRCPLCSELMPPIPGTSGMEWNTRGCYLHQSQPAGQTGNDLELEDPTNNILTDLPTGPALDDDPEAGPPPEPQKPGGSPAPAPLYVPRSPWQGRPLQRPRPWVEPGWAVWMSWGQEHMPTVQLVAGMVITWLLVLVAFR